MTTSFLITPKLQEIYDLQVAIGFLKDSNADADLLQVFEGRLQDLENELMEGVA